MTMCTFNLKIEDSVVDKIRPAFKDDSAMQEWMQQQLDMLVVQYVQRMPQRLQEKTSPSHSLSHLRGVFTSAKTDEQLMDEYLQEKYGV